MSSEFLSMPRFSYFISFLFLMKKANSPLRNPPTNTKPDGLISLLRPYFWLIFGLLAFTILSNGLNLFIPKLVSRGIDSYTAGTLDTNLLIFEFVGVSLLIFLFSTLQNIIQIYTSEQVAKDLRMRIIEKISLEDFDFVEHLTPSKLLTNITSDVDSVKTFVSQAIASILSSVFLIIGASTLLILINWKLGLSVLMIVPIIGVLFALVLGKVRKLFKAAQETIDWLNRIINESILGAALVRLLNSETFEYQKFLIANEKAKSI